MIAVLTWWTELVKIIFWKPQWMNSMNIGWRKICQMKWNTEKRWTFDTLKNLYYITFLGWVFFCAWINCSQNQWERCRYEITYCTLNVQSKKFYRKTFHWYQNISSFQVAAAEANVPEPPASAAPWPRHPPSPVHFLFFTVLLPFTITRFFSESCSFSSNLWFVLNLA